MGESYLACAERETLEETGLVVRAEKLLAVTNDVFSASRHYVTLFVLCRRVDESQEPKVPTCSLAFFFFFFLRHLLQLEGNS